jgi:hypothetical protein
MCTVSYIPLNGGFVLTSNRDETPKRTAALEPDFYTHDHISLYYPKDPEGNGIWIAVLEDERVACLLNGAFDAHIHRPPYTRSRGLVVLESFEYETPFHFYTLVDLNGVEPFTLIMVWSNNVYELRWTGTQKYFTSLPNAPYLWASATLYSSAVLRKKKIWLADFLTKQRVPQQAEVIQFHKNGGDQDLVNGMRIDRPGSVKTLSVTSIQILNSEVTVMQDDFEHVFEDSWDSHLKEDKIW